MKLKFTYLLAMIVFYACGQSKDALVWPNGAKAAICLTYDDGLPSHVNTVAPILKKYNFKATFYPTLSSESLYDDIDKWKGLTIDGHEIGNHMVYHPCQKSFEPWVEDYYDLDTYTLPQLEGEIQLANSFLSAIDVAKDRTFAYPCDHKFVGGVSYKKYVTETFSAARSSSEEQLEIVTPSKIDIFSVASWAPNENNAEELISYIDHVIESQTLSTFTFHGVGSEHMRVSKNDHEKMLKYLDANRDKIWVATFKEATDYLIEMRENEKKSK